MEPHSDSHASHAMRLRRVTGIPLARCFEFLAHLCVEERVRYVQHHEDGGGSMLIDPVELDPAKATAISAVKDQANALVAAGAFGIGMGAGGRAHHWIKTELRTRHGTEWRTAAEMNPHVAFDQSTMLRSDPYQPDGDTMFKPLTFVWTEEFGVLSPRCVALTDDDRNRQAIACLLSDDGGLGHTFLVADVRKAASDFERAARTGSAATWWREYWGARVVGNEARIHYVDDLMGTVPAEVLWSTLQAWSKFCAGPAVLGEKHVVHFDS